MKRLLQLAMFALVVSLVSCERWPAKPIESGEIYLNMKNGEKLMISRQYAPVIKNIVMGGGTIEK